MSSESIPANEYPDRVGFKPDNPYLETFQAVHSGRRAPAGIDGSAADHRHAAGNGFWRLVALSGSQSGTDGQRFDSGRGHFHHRFRMFSKFGLRDATILENNIVQTAGSAGESIAFGVGVTMPAIMILGFDLEFTRVMLVAMLGGLLGILMMIPLRRALIVAQHGYLKYPEGTACAEVLKAGASDESRKAAAAGSVADASAADEGAQTGAKTIFGGLGIGFVYQVLMTGLEGLEGHAGKSFWRAVQSRFGLGGNFAGAAGCRLHHRPAHRFDHVRRRRAGLPGSDSGNQIFRRRHDYRPASRNSADQRHESGSDSRRLHPLHRRGRRCRRRHHQSVPFAADDLERSEGRSGGSSRRPGGNGKCATHRSGPFDEVCDRRHHRPDRNDHGVSAIGTADNISSSLSWEPF